MCKSSILKCDKTQHCQVCVKFPATTLLNFGIDVSPTNNLDSKRSKTISSNSIRAICFLVRSMSNAVSRTELEEHVWRENYVGVNSFPVLMLEVRSILKGSDLNLTTIRNYGVALIKIKKTTLTI